jgi:iron(III) transport system ATP-binding protein
MVNVTAPRPATAPPAHAPAGDAHAVSVGGVTKAFGSAIVLRDVSVEVADGRMLALLGPSGCGKTTLLRIIAGLETPDAGEVRVGGRVLTGDGVAVPPERRRIGMVFQDWALFPHLDVGANVAYGLPRVGRQERARRVGEALDMVGLTGLERRAPGTLSGGQQQRVALARAIAPQPEVLLLDEPFSNLDSALRVQVRTEVHQLLVELGITTVFVTHDQEEAFVLGDEVAVMHDGEVVQQASPADLYRTPADRFVAAFVGDANLLPGSADGVTAHTSIGTLPLAASAEGLVDVLVRPEECKLRPGTEGQIELIEFYGHDTVYVVRVGGDRDGQGAVELRVRQGAAPEFRRGDRVDVDYAGGPTSAYPAELIA